MLWLGSVGSVGFFYVVLGANVRSLVLYGSEAWMMNKQMVKKIEAFEMWCWRRLLKNILDRENIERRSAKKIG